MKKAVDTTKNESKSIKVATQTKLQILAIAEKMQWKQNIVLKVAVDELYNKVVGRK